MRIDFHDPAIPDSEPLGSFDGSVENYDPVAVANIMRAVTYTADEFASALRRAYETGFQIGDEYTAAVRDLAEPTE